MKGDDWGKGQRTTEEAKDLLQRLVDILDAATGGKALLSSQGQGMSGIEELENYRVIARKARKLLWGEQEK